MILDRLDNAAMYRPLGSRIAAALDYLCGTNFSRVPDGRHELDGRDVFIIVQQYPTKPLAEGMWEAHRQYIDVQYVIQGAERIGYANLRGDLAAKAPYDAEKDVVFYDTTGDFFSLGAGDFAIFSPNDIHMPGLAPTPSSPLEVVRKAVVKCRVCA